MIASFDSITSKRHKKDIFERTLAIVLDVHKNKNDITEEEAKRYKSIMQTSSSTKANSNMDSNNESQSSSVESDDDASQNSDL